MNDSDLWTRVVAEGAFLVTADKGFGDVRVYPPGSHPGILVLRPERESLGAFVELVPPSGLHMSALRAAHRAAKPHAPGTTPKTHGTRTAARGDTRVTQARYTPPMPRPAALLRWLALVPVAAVGAAACGSVGDCNFTYERLTTAGQCAPSPYTLNRQPCDPAAGVVCQYRAAPGSSGTMPSDCTCTITDAGPQWACTALTYCVGPLGPPELA